VIENARTVLELSELAGSFARWLDAHHPLPREEWRRLFGKTFVFTGGEIVGEFLISLGYLPGAHRRGCPIWKEVARRRPPWMRRGETSFSRSAGRRSPG
jgi:DNA-3-methyladenine glycosylase I